MRTRELVRRGFVVFLCVAVGVTGCATTADMQKNYGDFGSCFRQEKQNYMIGAGVAGAVIGGVIGARVGDGRTSAVLATAGGVAGAMIGNRIAWQRCLTAFPPQSATLVVSDRASAVAQSETSGKSLAIQNLSGGRLVLGQDVEISVTYTYVSNNPAAQDIKARVSRHLMFKEANGTRHEFPSSTEDIIQQGVSRAKFSLPTPSINDAKELATTTDWAFKFVVEVDGMRQEKIIPLDGSQAAADTTSPRRAPAKPTSSPKPVTSQPLETTVVRAGTRLLRGANSSEIVATLPMAPAQQTVSVLQRIVQGDFYWVQVRLPDGQEGWFRGDKR